MYSNSIIELTKQVAINYVIIRLCTFAIRIFIFIMRLLISKGILLNLIAFVDFLSNICRIINLYWFSLSGNCLFAVETSLLECYVYWFYYFNLKLTISYNTISNHLSPFFAQVARKAFIYSKRRFINALGYASYIFVLFFIWTIASKILTIFYKSLKEEMGYLFYTPKCMLEGKNDAKAPKPLNTPPNSNTPTHFRKLKEE